MIDTRRARLAAIAVLLLALTATFVGSGMVSPDPADGRYPGTDAIVRDTQAHLGERVVITGQVTGTNPVVVRDTYSIVRGRSVSGGSVEFTVVNVDTAVKRGERVQVYGTLTEERTIEALDTIVVPPQNYLYMYGVSFLAGLWVLGRLLSQWTVNWQRLALVPRTEALSIRKAVATWIPSREEKTDA